MIFIEGRPPLSVTSEVTQGTVPWAEYQGILTGLQSALKLGVTDLMIFSNSMLVVQQVKGVWGTKRGGLDIPRAEVMGLLSRFSSYTIEWIPHHENQRASALSRQAVMDARTLRSIQLRNS